MREIDISEKCLDFIDKQGKRVSDKFFQLIEIMEEVRIVHSNFVKKLKNTRFYELRIKAGNEYRVIICKIRRKTDTHSDLKRTGILGQSGHPFCFKADTFLITFAINF
jgi:mRNA-degrading endonuclease RelE of RelBE toxin-antitoxin system